MKERRTDDGQPPSQIDKPLLFGDVGGLSFFIVLIVYDVKNEPDSHENETDQSNYKHPELKQKLKRYVHTLITSPGRESKEVHY